MLLTALHEKAGEAAVMERFLKDFAGSDESFAFDKVAKVAEYFEDRRQKVFANISVLIGGLCGGLMGGLVGSVATYLLTR